MVTAIACPIWPGGFPDLVRVKDLGRWSQQSVDHLVGVGTVREGPGLCETVTGMTRALERTQPAD